MPMWLISKLTPPLCLRAPACLSGGQTGSAASLAGRSVANPTLCAYVVSQSGGREFTT
jgi:hypothetical protein